MWGIAEFAETVGYGTLRLNWVVYLRCCQGRTALQGNIDPNILYCGREAIEREVKRMCEEFRVDGRGLVFYTQVPSLFKIYGSAIKNSGHGGEGLRKKKVGV
jgi:hypothetical protein